MIGKTIANEISDKLTREEQESLSENRQVDPEAFDLVAHGNFLISLFWLKKFGESAGNDAKSSSD